MLADFGAESSRSNARKPVTSCATGACTPAPPRCSTAPSTATRSRSCWTCKTERGRETVLELVEHCDVLLENFRPGTLEKWGPGPEVLNAGQPGPGDHPHLRLRTDGPAVPAARVRRGRRSLRRFAELVGDPDRAPVRVGVSIGDSIAGIYAAFGTVMSLFQREAKRNPPHPRGRLAATHHRRRAQRVDPVGDGIAGPDYLAYGVERERVGGRMEGIAPATPTPATTAPASSSPATATPSTAATCRSSAGPTSAPTPICSPTRGAGAPRRTRRRDRRMDVRTPATKRCSPAR